MWRPIQISRLGSSVDRAKNTFPPVPIRALSTTGELGQTLWNYGLLIITQQLAQTPPGYALPSHHRNITSTAGSSNALDLDGQGPAVGGQIRLAIQPQGLVSMGDKSGLAYLMCPGVHWRTGPSVGRQRSAWQGHLGFINILPCSRKPWQWLRVVGTTIK